MAQLKSMKLSAADQEKQSKPSMVDEGPRYPYGLSLHLDDQVLKKLDLESLPKVGSSKIIYARVDVTGISESENDYGDKKKRRTLSLQITDMCVEDDDEKPDPADALYKK